MEKVLETQKVVVAKVPSGASLVIFCAFVDGTPTEAQIETGRNALTATLEIVGKTLSNAYLATFKSVALQDDETLRLDVVASRTLVAPDPTANDETAAASENDATSTDAAAINETAADAETSEA